MPKNNLFNDPESGYRFLRLPDVLRCIPVSAATWWRWIAEGIAPKPVKLGPNVTAWREADIHAFAAKYSMGDSNDC